MSKSNYITKEGAETLRAELQYLWREKRPHVTREVSAAAALGDRSENAEYIYGKKMLREIDRRIRFLQKRLDALTVVDRLPDQRHKVFFGAWVTIEDEEGESLRFRIVGPDEAPGRSDYVSMDAPMGRACLGKTLDSEFMVRLPRGEKVYIITHIHYE